MSKKLFRITAVAMLIAAIIFVGVAVTHPENSWPWNVAITYILYGIYITAMICFFIVSIERISSKNKIILCVCAAVLMAFLVLYMIPKVSGPEYLYFRF